MYALTDQTASSGGGAAQPVGFTDQHQTLVVLGVINKLSRATLLRLACIAFDSAIDRKGHINSHSCINAGISNSGFVAP